MEANERTGAHLCQVPDPLPHRSSRATAWTKSQKKAGAEASRLVKTIGTSVQYPSTWNAVQGSEIFLCGPPASEPPGCLSKGQTPGLHSGLGSDIQHGHSLTVGLEGCHTISALVPSPVT